MSAAARQRRARARRRAGRMVAAVEVDEVAIVETLIDAGYLAARNAEDRAAIEAALAALLAELLALAHDEGE